MLVPRGEWLQSLLEPFTMDDIQEGSATSVFHQSKNAVYPPDPRGVPRRRWRSRLHCRARRVDYPLLQAVSPHCGRPTRSPHRQVRSFLRRLWTGLLTLRLFRRSPTSPRTARCPCPPEPVKKICIICHYPPPRAVEESGATAAGCVVWGLGGVVDARRDGARRTALKMDLDTIELVRS